MDKQERMLLLLAGAALVAVLVFKFKPDLLDSISVSRSSVADTPDFVAGSIDPNTVDPNGPAFLTIAQRYLWTPPVSMYIPGVTEGQIGQSDNATVANVNTNAWAS